MITAQDIVNQAYEELSITQMGTVPDGRQTAYGLKAFSRMLAALTNEGVNIAPDLPLQNEFEKPLVAILAMEIAPRFGVEPMPMLVKRAANGMASLQAAFVVAPQAQFDAALRNLPSQRLLGQRGVPFQIASVLPSAAPAVTGFVLLSTNSPTTTWVDSHCLVSSTVTLMLSRLAMCARPAVRS